MIQTITLDFTGKISGSTTENPNIGYLNGVEFTQQQYDLIFGNELRVTSSDILEFEFVVPNEAVSFLQNSNIYYKSKMDSGENELRCNDKAIYNNDQVTYKQKTLEIFNVDVNVNKINFKVTSTGNYGVYEVKIDVLYDDNGLNNYGGQYQFEQNGVVVTVPIQSKKLEEIITELESRPTNSITNVTFAQIGVESVD